MPTRKRSDLSRVSYQARKMKRRRQLESEFEKQLRQDIQRDRQVKRRASESENEQAIRKNLQRQRQAELRANESENLRNARLSRQRDRQRRLCSHESDQQNIEKGVAFEQVILKTYKSDPEVQQLMNDTLES